MDSERYFFEIPIYRVKRLTFQAQFEKDQASHLDRQRALGGVLPGQLRDWESMVRDRYWASYGAPWRFNQVVGWVRLFWLGSQLRGDLWLVRARRYSRRMAHKQFTLEGKAFEIWIDEDEADSEILAQLRQEFVELERAFKSRRLVLDLECFDNLAPHVRWRTLMMST